MAGRQNRNTKQKDLISDELAKIDSFFNAEELYDNVRKADDKIGLATVYRYLGDARNRGELYTYTCKRKTVYSKGRKSHCHFECEKTGRIFHFEVDNIDFLKDRIPGSITSFQLEVKGVCRDCGDNRAVKRSKKA